MANEVLGYSDFIKKVTLLIRDYEVSSSDNIQSLCIKKSTLKGGQRVLKISSLHYGEQQDTV